MQGSEIISNLIPIGKQEKIMNEILLPVVSIESSKVLVEQPSYVWQPTTYWAQDRPNAKC